MGIQTRSVTTLEELLSAGATVDTDTQRSSTTVGVGGVDIEASKRFRTTRRWTLPCATNLQTRFSREGMLTRLKKIVSTEIQVGDPDFDDVVYVQSKTLEATQDLLVHDRFRSAVRQIVGDGGQVQIDGDQVVIWIDDRFDFVPPDPRVEVCIVATVMEHGMNVPVGGEDGR